MTEEEYDIETFLLRAGFTQEEVLNTVDELCAYRSIPGTTLIKYLNRVLVTIEADCRPAFLKGVIVGTALHKHMETDQLEEHINREVTKRLSEILMDIKSETKTDSRPEYTSLPKD